MIVSWCWRLLEWTGLLRSSPAALQECEAGPDGDGRCERSGVRRGRGGCVRRWGGGVAFVCFPRFKTRTEKWIDRGKSIAWPSHRARVKEGGRERERDGEGEPRSNGGTMRDKRKSKMAVTQKKWYFISLYALCVWMCCVCVRVCSCACSAGEWQSLWIMGWLNLLCLTVRPMALKRIHAHILARSACGSADQVQNKRLQFQTIFVQFVSGIW